MQRFCSCKIQLTGVYDDNIRSGVEVQIAKSGPKSAYKPWRDRIVTIDDIIANSSYYVKVAFDHVNVCTEKVSGGDVWMAYWEHACAKGHYDGRPSDTMLKSLRTAARKINNPEVNAFITALEVHSG